MLSTIHAHIVEHGASWYFGSKRRATLFKRGAVAGIYFIYLFIYLFYYPGFRSDPRANVQRWQPSR